MFKPYLPGISRLAGSPLLPMLLAILPQLVASAAFPGLQMYAVAFVDQPTQHLHCAAVGVSLRSAIGTSRLAVLHQDHMDITQFA
jgi:hypothetical protein